MRRGAQIRDARAAEGVDLGHRFADDDVLRFGGEALEGFFATSVLDVSLVNPDAGLARQMPQDSFEFVSGDMTTGGAVGVYEDNEVVTVAHGGFEPFEIHRVIVLSGERQ